MQIKRVYNLTDAESILNNPTIKREISEGYVDSASVTLVDKRSHIYLVGYVDSIPIGLFILHPNKQGKQYCHIQVIPEYRGKYSESFGRMSASWVWDNTPVSTVYADIPYTSMNVINFCKLMGFTQIASDVPMSAHLVIHKEDCVCPG